MKFTIKNILNNSVMFEIEADSFVKAVEKKVAERANLRDAYLGGAYLRGANLRGAYLTGANLRGAYLRGAYLGGANLTGANLRGADLGDANLTGANLGDADLGDAYLGGAYLGGAYLRGANLTGADLGGANLRGAYLRGAYLGDAYLGDADLGDAYLRGADLTGADLTGAKNLVKIMGVEPGNCYWKRFDKGLNNNGYQFYVGLNTLRDGEVFASDDRITCSFPGFHFASRSWCAAYYGNRPLEARIRIPEDAQINEPWATDGKCSADRIEILEVFDTKTGKNVTHKFVRPKVRCRKVTVIGEVA